MKKQKTKEDLWLVLGLINLLALVYPMTSYLRADGIEDQVLSVGLLIGVSLILVIFDTVSIAVSYSK